MIPSIPPVFSLPVGLSFAFLALWMSIMRGRMKDKLFPDPVGAIPITSLCFFD
jgi:hypothetical protein